MRQYPGQSATAMLPDPKAGRPDDCSNESGFARPRPLPPALDKTFKTGMVLMGLDGVREIAAGTCWFLSPPGLGGIPRHHANVRQPSRARTGASLSPTLAPVPAARIIPRGSASAGENET